MSDFVIEEDNLKQIPEQENYCGYMLTLFYIPLCQANIIGALNNSSAKKKFHADADKAAFLSAWQRVDCRTREALRRSFLSDLIASYEVLDFAFASLRMIIINRFF